MFLKKCAACIETTFKPDWVAPSKMAEKAEERSVYFFFPRRNWETIFFTKRSSSRMFYCWSKAEVFKLWVELGGRQSGGGGCRSRVLRQICGEVKWDRHVCWCYKKNFYNSYWSGPLTNLASSWCCSCDTQLMVIWNLHKSSWCASQVSGQTWTQTWYMSIDSLSLSLSTEIIISIITIKTTTKKK